MACGDDGGSAIPDAPPTSDAPEQQCLPQGAVGAFYRRQPNPKLIAGNHTFTDGALDTKLLDPDLVWDGTSWHLYYQSPHGISFSTDGPLVIRHATSTDLMTWSFDDTPALTVAASGWDSTRVATPSVAYNPDAPADRRFVMVYSGATQDFPHAAHDVPDYAIGVAFSADGHSFTRAGDGKVLDAAQVYTGALDGIVTDPEILVVNGTYHLFFSSFACSGANCTTIDAYGIAHATSADAVTWTIVEAPVRSLLQNGSILTTGYGKPSVIYDEARCRWELWMADTSATNNQPVTFDNMTGVLHATSSNGMTWTKDSTRDLTWDDTAPGETLGLHSGADVAQKGTGRYLIYVGFDDADVPNGSVLPTGSGPVPGVFTLNLATRDAQL